MRMLGIDFGTKRIGLAVCDEDGLCTRGLQVVFRKGGRQDLEAVCAAAREHQIEALVMGLPLNMDGSEGRMTRSVRDFAHKRRRESGEVDKLAAALILQSYLQATQKESS